MLKFIKENTEIITLLIGAGLIPLMFKIIVSSRYRGIDSIFLDKQEQIYKGIYDFLVSSLLAFLITLIQDSIFTSFKELFGLIFFVVIFLLYIMIKNRRNNIFTFKNSFKFINKCIKLRVIGRKKIGKIIQIITLWPAHLIKRYATRINLIAVYILACSTYSINYYINTDDGLFLLVGIILNIWVIFVLSHKNKISYSAEGCFDSLKDIYNNNIQNGKKLFCGYVSSSKNYALYTYSGPFNNNLYTTILVENLSTGTVKKIVENDTYYTIDILNSFLKIIEYTYSYFEKINLIIEDKYIDIEGGLNRILDKDYNVKIEDTHIIYDSNKLKLLEEELIEGKKAGDVLNDLFTIMDEILKEYYKF